jgi:hypothetical protein
MIQTNPLTSLPGRQDSNCSQTVMSARAKAGFVDFPVVLSEFSFVCRASARPVLARSWPFVWQPDQIVVLFDSLLKGYLLRRRDETSGHAASEIIIVS